MRIISDFKDYYDCGQRYGQDHSLIYLRKQAEEDIEPPFPTPNQLWRIDCRHEGGLPETADFYAIGFAGKLYPMFDLLWQYEHAFCYSLDTIYKELNKHCSKHALNEFTRKRHFYRYDVCEKNFVDFFKEWEAFDQTRAAYLFEQHPIWIVRGCWRCWKIIFNACLKDYEFYKVKDPMTAYQELAMYLGGKAAPEKPLPKVDDKTMAEIKGFNKFSFRKDKSDKR